MKKLLSCVLCVSACGASLLEQRLDEILRTSRILAPGEVGVEVVQLRSGKVLYATNSDKLFTPASNTKLFSTALALSRLGRDYRLKTRIYTAAGVDGKGRVASDLVLYGGGDPSLSDQVIPYTKEDKPGDALLAIEELADQIVAKGVREIQGDIVGDDTAWPSEPLPPGWAADDTIYEYGAPVSALNVNSGRFRLTILPGAAVGDPARLTLIPPVEYFAISNRVITSDSTQKIDIDRPLGSHELRISGSVALGKPLYKEDLAVDDPALFAAIALYEALTRRGVAVSGAPLAHHREQGEAVRPPAGSVLVERSSPPLVELLRVVGKVSQNLWAEMMLREVARVRAGDGSRVAALQELKAFLDELGAPKDDYVFEDGSGLSRLTLVSPAVVVRLLNFMYLSPAGPDYKSLLPVGAMDGSLEKRFSKNKAANAISAKTGSLSHVNSLSGYAESATYGEVAFSILVNHTSGKASEVRAAIDKLALALLE